MKKNYIIGGIIIIIVAIGFVFLRSQGSQQGNSSSDFQNSTEGKTISGYSGKVLAGTTAPFIIYTKADYDKALSSGKVVFLDFYANWCPICKEELPILKDGFASLKTDKIVGFRVNYNDSDTDDNEKALAGQLSIAYQHTTVILKNGKETFRSLEAWDKEAFAREINKAISQ